MGMFHHRAMMGTERPRAVCTRCKGKLWSQVNFCPWCGKKTEAPIEEPPQPLRGRHGRAEYYVRTPIADVPINSWDAMMTWLQANPWCMFSELQSAATIYNAPNFIHSIDRRNADTWTLRPRFRPENRPSTSYSAENER